MSLIVKTNEAFVKPFFDIIRVGNVGTLIQVQLARVNTDDPNNPFLEPFPTGPNDEVFIDLRKPSGKILRFPASVVPPADSGLISVVDNEGVFDKKGRYATRGVCKVSGSSEFRGGWFGFPVDE
jgi:hypothetical protein